MGAGAAATTWGARATWAVKEWQGKGADFCT